MNNLIKVIINLIEFIDVNDFLKTDEEMNLTKEALNGIYIKFNDNTMVGETIENDDL